MKLMDAACAWIPRPRPSEDRLRGCRLIAHRGAGDNREVFENTAAAFDRVRDAGVWGIELDVRWTRDLQPVVYHDPDLWRLFGLKTRIRDLTLAELKSAYALIPSLGEVIARYGKQLHLMVELKREKFPDPPYQNRLLQKLFEPLEPAVDFHLISLDPELFQMFDFAPRRTLLPIAKFNVAALSRLSLHEGYGGVLGHYFLLTGSVLKTHQDRGQQLGTGFVNSERCLYRELNRGVTWIFSDKAVALQAACRASPQR